MSGGLSVGESSGGGFGGAFGEGNYPIDLSPLIFGGGGMWPSERDDLAAEIRALRRELRRLRHEMRAHRCGWPVQPYWPQPQPWLPGPQIYPGTWIGADSVGGGDCDGSSFWSDVSGSIGGY